MRVRYGRWSGTQEPFPHELTAERILDELSDDLLDGVDPAAALRRLLQRGMGAMRGQVAGLAELRRRVDEARRRELGRMGLDGPLEQLAERLDEIIDRERTAAGEAAARAAAGGGDPDEDAARGGDPNDLDAGPGEARQAELDALPPDVAGRIAALEDSDWIDPQAHADFVALLDELRRDLARAAFGRLAGAMQSMDAGDMQQLRDLLADLNELIDADARGEDTSAAFEEFKERYGDLLPGDPDTLDELLEELARRQAALSRMLAGLDAEQRDQLARMAEELLGGDLDLQFQADRLGRALRGRFPGLPWDEGLPSEPGAEPAGSMAGAVDWVEHLQAYEDLAEALAQDYPGARLEDVDEEALRRLVGDDAARDLTALREIERLLEEAGAVQRHQGRLELTPRGLRALGERALLQIYDRALDGGVGSHGTPRGGGEGEPTGTTRRWRFGDPFRLDVSETVRNAVRRGGVTGSARGGGAAVRLDPDDFALAESERRVRAATVLLLDMSFSMPLRGNWTHAKRMALALQSLVASKFPEDTFYVVGFSDYARRLQPQDLLVSGWERVYGTNMQHAFMLARRLLGAHPADDQQVIMVTDGEPTAHLEGDQAFFAWPPEPLTLRLTLAEAARLARAGATLNVFLLDHEPGAAEFVELMVSRGGGRIFYPDLHDLGSMVVRDFLRGRRR